MTASVKRPPARLALDKFPAAIFLRAFNAGGERLREFAFWKPRTAQKLAPAAPFDLHLLAALRAILIDKFVLFDNGALGKSEFLLKWFVKFRKQFRVFKLSLFNQIKTFLHPGSK